MTTILVTGATGNIGSHLVRDLCERDVRVRAFVRDEPRGRAVLGDDVDLAVGDYGDSASVAAALHGVDRLFLLTPSHPDMVQWERTVLDTASASGVGLVVKISTVGADPDTDARFLRWQGQCEEVLRASGIPAVVLRSSTHMTNVLFAADTIKSDGRIFTPLDEAKIAMVDRRDLAGVAALALTEAGHEGRGYLVTGPQAITYREVAAQLSEVVGRSVEYADVPDEGALAAMLQAGAPEWMAEGIGEVNQLLRCGMAAETSDVVRVLLGREPYSFADFARDIAPALR
jgi:uncharacterized protein YbjT (DUF2867 family)